MSRRFSDGLPPRLSNQQLLVLAAGLPHLEKPPAGIIDRPSPGDTLDAARSAIREEFGASSQSVSRTLRRLEERGLARRDQRDGYTDALWLTDDGLAAATEARRRHNDGRYALSFDVLDAETEVIVDGSSG
jgi:DNA-binding MarR family transcriptional regulator